MFSEEECSLNVGGAEQFAEDDDVLGQMVFRSFVHCQTANNFLVFLQIADDRATRTVADEYELQKVFPEKLLRESLLS